VRELRASAKRACARGEARAATHALVLSRTDSRARSSDAANRRRDLDRLALALAAHDPARTLSRGYALAEDRTGQPLGSAAEARSAVELRLRFHDGSVDAEVNQE
jgi:exodeoxyribonuclease VII large subunit